jgi:transmembrane sensor
MPPKKTSLQRVFRNFITGRADGREQSIFWAWLWNLNIDEKQTVGPNEAVQERIWEKVAAQTVYRKQGTVIPLWKKLSVSAAVVMAVAFTAWALFVTQKHNSTGIARHSVISSDSNAIRHVVLPDGTEVTLNIYSSLEFNDAYNKTERRVTLKGEGYFKIHKDSTRPFIVHSNGIETRALGTAFNIEAREREKQVRVALTEGKVVIDPVAGKQQHFLAPGQILYYDRATSRAITLHYTTNVTAWTRGGLAFNGLPLTEALERLSQHYHVTFRYDKEKLSGKLVTASFNKTTCSHILTNILYPYDLQFLINGNVITIQ